MTKRSSFVMPPVLACVAAIVDILDRSPKLMQSRAELGRIKPWASLHGNIAPKPLPIRLLALGAAMSGRQRTFRKAGLCSQHPAFCGAQTARVNRLTTWRYCALACNHPSGDNYSLFKAGTGFPATLSQEINDCRCQQGPRH